MIRKRPAAERGHADFGWLDTRYTFSFGKYVDPNHMGFRTLRVINDDTVAPGKGFGTHGHDNMEIVTYVVEGALEHKDSMGTGSVLRPGDVQRMSAGTGVTHSEFNHSAEAPLRLLQIWIRPAEHDLEPAYEEKHFSRDAKRATLLPIVSSEDGNGALDIRQDASIYASVVAGGERVTHTIDGGRAAWVQVVSGDIAVNGVGLGTGDGAAITEEDDITIEGTGDEGEFLLFDLGA